MTPKPQTRPAGVFVEDFDVYPRKSVSSANVANICEALRADKILPPLVITEDDKIIDGVHRGRAYRRVFGPDHPVPVIVETFADKAAMLARSVELNTGRGMDLTRWDIDRVLTLAEEHGLQFDEVAKRLGWDAARLKKYRESRVGKTLDDKKIALKRTIRHKLDQPLTARQVEANEHLSGMSPLFTVGQLIELLEADLLPETDPKLTERLEHLHTLLGDWLTAHPGEAETA